MAAGLRDALAAQFTFDRSIWPLTSLRACAMRLVSLSGACRCVPVCRVLPHSAALQIRRISLTVIRISVCAHHRSRSHNREVGDCNRLFRTHLQTTSVLPNTEVNRNPQRAGVSGERASNRHAPASPDTPRCALRPRKPRQHSTLRQCDLRFFRREVGEVSGVSRARARILSPIENSVRALPPRADASGIGQSADRGRSRTDRGGSPAGSGSVESSVTTIAKWHDRSIE